LQIRMNASLSRDWITAPAIDLELKRYVLLAYLQGVNGRFVERRLFPHLGDLHDHLQRLSELQNGMDALRDAGPKDLVGIDALKGRFTYRTDPDPEALQVISEVIGFAMPELKAVLDRGQQLLSEILEQVRFEPVGVLPLDVREGYVFVRRDDEARVYSYTVPMIRDAAAEQHYHGLRTHYVTSYSLGIAWGYEQIKADLTRVRRELPIPATFVLETERPLPCVETCLPLARRLLWRHVASLAA
jgi:hypothetical protein